MERKENFAREYTILFNGITDTIENLEALLLRLKRLQSEAEETFVAAGE